MREKNIIKAVKKFTHAYELTHTYICVHCLSVSMFVSKKKYNSFMAAVAI